MQPPSTAPGGGGGGGLMGALGKLAPWAPVVGSVVGYILDKATQDRANKATAQNVDKQIAFQKEQSETSYQRAVEDMRKAGMNPALAYKQGGADSMSGAAAENRAGPSMREAVAAYNDFANATAQRQLIREQAALTGAQARKTTMEGTILQPEYFSSVNTDYLGDYQKMKREELAARRHVAQGGPKRFDMETAQLAATTNTAGQQARYLASQSTINEQQFQNKWYRQNIAPWVNSTAHAVRAAKGFSPYGGWD